MSFLTPNPTEALIRQNVVDCLTQQNLLQKTGFSVKIGQLKLPPLQSIHYDSIAPQISFVLESAELSTDLPPTMANCPIPAMAIILFPPWAGRLQGSINAMLFFALEKDTADFIVRNVEIPLEGLRESNKWEFIKKLWGHYKLPPQDDHYYNRIVTSIKQAQPLESELELHYGPALKSLRVSQDPSGLPYVVFEHSYTDGSAFYHQRNHFFPERRLDTGFIHYSDWDYSFFDKIETWRESNDIRWRESKAGRA